MATFSGGGGQSYSSGAGGSSSWSGVADQDMLNRIKASLDQYPADIGAYKSEGLQDLAKIGQTAIKQPFTDMLNSLAKRNILNSSVVGDSVKKMSSQVGDSLLSYGTDIINKSNAARLNTPSIIASATDPFKSSTSSSWNRSQSTSANANNSAGGLTMFEAIAGMM